MNGMEMMLKSFGFDPDTIRQKLDETVDGFRTLIENYRVHVDARFDALEARLKHMDLTLQGIYHRQTELEQHAQGLVPAGKGANQVALEKELEIHGHLMGVYPDGE